MKILKLLPILLISFCALAEEGTDLPPGLLKPCNDKDANVKDIYSGDYGQVPQMCQDQIKTSLENCFNPPTADSDEKTALNENAKGAAQALSNVGMNGEAQYSIQSSQIGIKRYNGKANVCIDERGKADDVCKQAEDELKQALRANTDHDVSLQLQTQINATDTAREKVANTLSEQATCNLNQASIYQHEMNKAEGVLNASNNSGVGQLAGKAVDAAKEPAEKLGVQTAVSYTTAAVPALETAGGVALKAGGPVVSALNDDPAGAATGTAQLAASSISSDAGMVASRFLGPVGFYFGSVTSTARCDTIISDPVQAYKMNCQVNSVEGASSNEAAIGTLAQQ